jgi:hypothetical protein
MPMRLDTRGCSAASVFFLNQAAPVEGQPMGKLGKKKRVYHFAGLFAAAAVALLIGNWMVWAEPPQTPSTVTVSVTDAPGHPVPLATVTIQGSGKDPAHYRQGLSGGTGVFQAQGLTVGNYVITAKLGNLSTSKTVLVPGDTERFVQISLVTIGVTVSGMVTSGPGSGAGNVRLVLAGNYPPLERQARSDGSGSFAVVQVPDGRFLLAAEDEQGRYLSAGRQVVVSDGQVQGPPITILLSQPQQAGTISGQVFSTELNSEEYRFEVTASDASGAIQARTTLARGQAAFKLSGLPPGVYRLELLRLGAPSARREVGATPGVVLNASGNLTGVSVVDLEP